MPTPTPEFLILRAVETGAPVESVERLYALWKDVQDRAAETAFNVAFAAFQAEMPEVKKNKIARVEKNGNLLYTYKYADLADMQRQVGPALAKHGFSYRFEAKYGATIDDHRVACILMHKDGFERPSEVKLVMDEGFRMNDVQKGGASLTYAKRYAFGNATGVTPDEDTDAQGGGGSVYGGGGGGREGGSGPSPAGPSGAAQGRPAGREDLGACPDCGVIGSLRGKRNGNVFCMSAAGGCGHEWKREEFDAKQAAAREQAAAIREQAQKGAAERAADASPEPVIVKLPKGEDEAVGPDEKYDPSPPTPEEQRMHDEFDEYERQRQGAFDSLLKEDGEGRRG